MSDSGTSTNTTTLAITFSGPLVHVFPSLSQQKEGAQVTIYAPYCPYHSAGIFFSDWSYSESDLWTGCRELLAHASPSDRAYSITSAGIRSASQPPEVHPLPPSSAAATSADPAFPPFVRISQLDSGNPRIDKAMFRLTVPVPLAIYPLYPDSVHVVDRYATTPPDTKLLGYCTGLRFLYEWDRQPVLLHLPAGAGTRPITPPLHALYGEVEVRYQGPDMLDENDRHSDARACFASMVNVVGKEFWLNYGDGKCTPTNPSHPVPPQQHGGMRVHGHPGGDCYAPALVVWPD